MPSRSSHFAFIVAVILFLVAFAVFITVKAPPLNQGPAAKELISYEKANELLRFKNEGIAYLENAQYAESDPLLERLTEELPREVIGFRNLTICRLLQLTPEKIQADQEFAKQAISTVNQLIQIAPDSDVSYVLSARIYTALGDLQQALAALQRAIQYNPEDAAVWYELSEVQKQIQKPEEQEKAKSSLEKAWELQSDNLFLTLDYLQVVVGQKAEQAVPVFEKVKQLAGPLADSVKDHTRLDLNKLIDDSVTAIRDQKWNLVIRNARILRNVLIAEDLVKSDRRRVEQNPLEFVIHDFPAEFYTAVEWPARQKPLTVEFTEPDPLKFSTELPPDIRDLQIADFDLDGKPDLILLSAEQVSVFTQNESGIWEIVASQTSNGDYSEVHAVDLDADVQQLNQAATSEKKEQTLFPVSPSRDADLDLVLSGKSGIKVFENQWDSKTGKRTLVLKAQKNDLAVLSDVLAVNFSDIDHDGDLDLVASTSRGLSLWSNRGDFSFQDISMNSQLPPDSLAATSIVRVDWDRDVDLDLILCSRQSKQAGYLENLRHGRFRWRQFDAKEKESAINQFEECRLVDFDRNGSWDLIGVSRAQMMLVETNRPLPGSVQIASVRPLKEAEPVNNAENVILQTGDLNNDGVLDVVASSPNGLQLCLGTAEQKAGQTVYVKDQVIEFPKPIQKFLLYDLNQDGNLDVIVVTENQIVQRQNKGNDYHWLDISLRAEQVKGEVKSASGRVNHYGIGSLLELRSGTIYQPQIVAGQSTHFGLGKQTVAEAIRVLWTNGIPVNIINAKTDQRIYEKQTLMGSCPYLYTWDGEQFSFYTDLLWAAPIGLQFGKGIVAPCRDWEFLKIEGDRLKEKDGFYELRVTEELWEAGYFDTIQLLAIDHPADVEIFSNEKVGPPDLAAFKIHTVKNSQLPVAAINQRGRDVLAEIKHADDVYSKTFDHKYRQGLTEDHILELDLGNLERLKSDSNTQITLFLKGWLYPTDTGINLALSENPTLPSPRPPSLSVPDKNGNWKIVQPFMGFPGGKTKTIAVDLTNQFLSHDYRVRIETNMEFYWDQVFFTVGESTAEIQQRPLSLESATLRYRGFSTRVIHGGNGPECYDYHRLSNMIQWPPMQGSFTRYGDVKALVELADNRMVIMGAGDEMRLRFEVPEKPLKMGWKRDFILYNVGWDKDANLHTILGQTVEPLPFREMKSYPYPTESFPAESRLQADQETYHTRRQNSAAFWKYLQTP